MQNRFPASTEMAKGTLRGRRLFGPRSRTQALPQASLSFLVIVAFLAAWFSGRDSPENPFDVHNSLLDVAAVRSGSTYGDLCNRGDFFSSSWSLFLLIPGVIVTFVGLAIVTDDYFVSSLERICERLSLSEDVAGATFMAAGSSTPEFFASLLGVFVTNDEVGIGTIVGSAVFNILVIIGLSAALAGAVLKLDWRPLLRDSSFYVLSIVLLLVFTLGPSKGEIEWWEGLILVIAYVLYVLFMAFGNKYYMSWAGKLTFGRSKGPDVDEEAGMAQGAEGAAMSLGTGDAWADTVTPSTSAEKPRYGDLNPRTRLRALQFAVIAANRLASSSSENSDGDEILGNEESSSAPRLLGVELPTSVLGWVFFPVTFTWRVLFSITIVDCSREDRARYWWATFLLSIAWISGISYAMVEAARKSGCLIGIPAPAMGLTVIAAGTSVPDALASISVARDGAGDMAVSNAIGSNVFDILLGLGFPWFLGGLIKGKIDIPVDPLTTVVVPIVILFVIIITLVMLLVILRWELRPLLGYLLFAIYGLFVLYTLLDVYVFKLGR